MLGGAEARLEATMPVGNVPGSEQAETHEVVSWVLCGPLVPNGKGESFRHCDQFSFPKRRKE